MQCVEEVSQAAEQSKCRAALGTRLARLTHAGFVVCSPASLVLRVSSNVPARPLLRGVGAVKGQVASCGQAGQQRPTHWHNVASQPLFGAAERAGALASQVKGSTRLRPRRMTTAVTPPLPADLPSVTSSACLRQLARREGMSCAPQRSPEGDMWPQARAEEVPNVPRRQRAPAASKQDGAPQPEMPPEGTNEPARQCKRGSPTRRV
jgi:hypothetical protein